MVDSLYIIKKMGHLGHTLLLNASFEPLHVVPWYRAMQLLYQGKVEVLEESDKQVRTVSLTIKVPAVLRLLKYIPLVKKRQTVRFSRANVFIRDKNTCQYCGKICPRSYLTLDHIIPTVQGGGKRWENIVSACKSCNQKKGGKTPQQARMKLIRKPKQPHWLPTTSLQIGIAITPDSWRIYLNINNSNELDSS